MIDPLGGINTLWPLFGISNQMLAAIALILCTVVLFKMKRQRYAWVTIVPAIWLVVCTRDRRPGEDLQHRSGDRLRRPRAGVRRAAAGASAGAGEDDGARCSRVMFNDYVDATLCALFVAVVRGDGGLRRDRHPQGAWATPKITAVESGLAGAAPGGALPDLLTMKCEWKERGQAAKTWSVRARG